MWNPAVPGMEDAHICAVLSFRRIRRYPVLLFKTAEKHVRFTEVTHHAKNEMLTLYQDEYMH